MVVTLRKFGIKFSTEAIAVNGHDNSWGYAPKIKNPYDSHTKFPCPHELIGNNESEGREKYELRLLWLHSPAK